MADESNENVVRGILEENIPVPDPSVLTTAQLNREIMHLRELLEAQISQNNDTVSTSINEVNLRNQQRFEAQSKALDIAFASNQSAITTALIAAEKATQTAINTCQKNIDNLALSLRDVMDQKFLGRQALLDDRDKLLDEKLRTIEDVNAAKFDAFEGVRNEIDLRNQQRFDAQTKALDAAFLSAQTAVQAALNAADKGIQAAMSASEKAVAKAETAAEKRFDSNMEFQKAFNETVQQQIPRKEAETRFDSMTDKFDSRLQDMSIKIDDLKAFANSAGGGRVAQSMWGYLIGGIGVMAAIIAIVVGISMSRNNDAPSARTAADNTAFELNSRRIDDLQTRLTEAQRRLDAQAAAQANGANATNGGARTPQ